MQVGTIAVVENNCVESMICLIADINGVIQQGKYAGQRLGDSLDIEFYNACREIDPSLPENPLNDEDEEPENYPDFDAGYWEFEDRTVCITWANST